MNHDFFALNTLHKAKIIRSFFFLTIFMIIFACNKI